MLTRVQLADAQRLAIMLALLTLAAVTASADWPMFRGDAARSGLAPDEQLSAVAVAWSAELGGSVDSSPAVAGGTVFVGNSLGLMHAVSAEDGSALWSFETGGAVVSSPAVADGTVVFGSVDGFLYALDAADGRERWRYRTRGAVLSSPAVVDGRVIFGSMDGRMYCLALEDGSLLWRTEAGAGIQGAPAVAGDVVLHGDDDGRMRALRLADGVVAWEHEGRGRVIVAPVVGEGVAIFAVMGPSALRPPKLDYLVALRPGTGERLWAQNEAYSVLGAPVIGGGRVFFVTVEGYVSKTVARAANLADGARAWERQVGGVVDSSPVVIGSPTGFDEGPAGMIVCFGCHDGRLYLLDAETGRIADVESLAQKIYSSPAVSGGRIFIGANDGRLYCLTAEQ
ncbi:MAG: PQQ-binding-like beta-propeller repeat protein [Armatimonadota bacterium]